MYTYCILYRYIVGARKLFRSRDSRNGIRLADANSCSLLFVIPATSDCRPRHHVSHILLQSTGSTSVSRKVFLPLFRQTLFRPRVYFMTPHAPPLSTPLSPLTRHQQLKMEESWNHHYILRVPTSTNNATVRVHVSTFYTWILLLWHTYILLLLFYAVIV